MAEDDDDAVFLLQRSFHQLGFGTPVHYVRNGEQAIAYLSGNGRYADRGLYPLPTLLLLDLKMPRKNGFEVLQWVQQQPDLARIRIVVLTTAEDIASINAAYKLGAASFLTKPVHFTEFKDTIHSLHAYWMILNKPPEIQRPRNPIVRNPYQFPIAEQG